jgi:hypothetical protein
VFFYMEVNEDDNPQLEFVMPDADMPWSEQTDCSRGMLVCALVMIDLVTLPWVVKEHHQGLDMEKM